MEVKSDDKNLLISNIKIKNELETEVIHPNQKYFPLALDNKKSVIINKEIEIMPLNLTLSINNSIKKPVNKNKYLKNEHKNPVITNAGTSGVSLTKKVPEDVLDYTNTNNEHTKEFEIKLEPEVIIDCEEDEEKIGFNYTEEKQNIDNKYEDVYKTRKTHKCDICDRIFLAPSRLAQHYRLHTGERPYKCDLCDKEFAASVSLVQHKLVHSGEKPFKCIECNKAFTKISNLTVHQRTHTGERPFKCDECDKTFTQLAHLIRHQRTHTGEKPFECEFCEKAFSHASTLSQHKVIHTGEKPFKCQDCGKAYAQRQGLLNHKRNVHMNMKK